MAGVGALYLDDPLRLPEHADPGVQRGSSNSVRYQTTISYKLQKNMY